MMPAAAAAAALHEAFGVSRYDRAVGTSRAWLLKTVLEEVRGGDPRRLASLADQGVLLIERALSVAELMALELLDDWANDPKGAKVR
jgi:hypothetical protein